MPQPASAGFFYLTDTELAELWRHARRHANDLGRSELGGRLATNMRISCPVAGSTWSKFLTFLLMPGRGLSSHKHQRHAMLWYPQETVLVVAGENMRCATGSLLYLPPNTPHHVPPSTVERLSVAMLVSEPVNGETHTEFV